MTTTSLPDPPGPRKLVSLTTLLSYARSPLVFGLRLQREYGDVVSFRAMGMQFVLLSHPDDIEHVLVKGAANFTKDRFLHELADVLGQGLLVAEGDFWRRQRKLAQPAFHHDRIRAYAALMVEETKKHTSRYRAGETRDLREEMMHITLDIVTRTLFSAEVGDEAPAIGRALDAVMVSYLGFLNTGVRLPAYLPTLTNLRFKRAVKTLDRIVRRIVAERRVREDGATPPDPAEVRTRGDLLAMLMAARDEDGARMSDDQIRDEVVTLMLAGHETTALTLTYAHWLLAHHPEVLQTLRAELDLVLGGRDATFDDLPRLRFCDAVVHESMRLYPPAWVLGREVKESYEVRGFTISKGAQLQVMPWVVHRDPRHFEAPDEFRPSRWMNGLAKQLPRFAYFPFGGGPRICIGNAFAKMEAILALATFVQQVEVALVPGQKLELVPSITLRPKHPLRAVVTPRR